MSGRFCCTHTGPYDASAVQALCDALSIAPLTARALLRRGLSDPDDARRFLHPDQQPLLDPYLLPDMAIAVDRLRKAVLEDEFVCVYGDYDADGICATAILLDCLTELGARVTAYIPQRQSEGYGMHPAAMEKLSADGVTLIVTVDTGISASSEIAFAQSLGMDVIVTDHHSISGRIPACDAVVSALRPEALYPNPYLCGAGLSLQLCRAISGDERLNRWLPLAGLATIADIVPLVGENRVIAARGLPLTDENLGLNTLLRVAGNNGREIDETTVAFMLAPRLNAAGRMGDAMRAVRLLCTRDRAEANVIAEELDGENTRRKSIEAAILMEAEEQLAESPCEASPAILLSGKGWNTGVIGIVASRLCEMKNRPTILFSENEEGIMTGSGRSIEGIDLHAALCRCQDRLLRFGGHAGAAGVTIAAAKYADFCREFNDYLSTAYSGEVFERRSRFDEAVGIDELTLSSVAELRLLAPFGEGNGEPVYCLSDMRLSEVRRIGREGRHLSARISGETASLRGVAFGWGDRERTLSAKENWTVLVKAGINSYRGRESVELQLTDVEAQEKVFNDFFSDILYNGIDVEDFGLIRYVRGTAGFPDQTTLRRMFSAFSNQIGPDGVTPYAMAQRYSVDLRCAMLVFCELGFYAFDRVSGVIRRNPAAPARELSQSVLYRIWSMKD